MAKTKKDLNLPRAPLPKQRSEAHRRKNKVLARKAKHKATRKFDFTRWTYADFDW